MTSSSIVTTPTTENFIPWLGNEMRKRGVRQIDLASGIGRSQTLISRWFSGKTEITPAMVQDVHRYFGTTEADVIAIEQAPTQAKPDTAARVYAFGVPSGTATLTLPPTLTESEISLLECWFGTFISAEREALNSR